MKTISKRLEALETRKRPSAYVDVLQAREDFILPIIEATCGSDCSERTDECIRWWDCERLWDAVAAAAAQVDKNDTRARSLLESTLGNINANSAPGRSLNHFRTTE
ncbi:MAG: hypothetical protein WCB79_02525 [Halobacteriota archaeon]